MVKNHDQSLVGNVLGIATDILGRALCQRPPCSEANVMTNNKSCPNEAFTVLPRKVKLGQNKVVALLNEPLMKDDWVKVKIEKSGEMIEILNFKKRNPYTLQFSIPGKELLELLCLCLRQYYQNQTCNRVLCSMFIFFRLNRRLHGSINNDRNPYH